MPKFELEPYHRNTSEEELLKDLKRVASQLGKNSVTTVEYNTHGNYHSSTLCRKFGSWFKVVSKAGLKETNDFHFTEEAYFKNLEEVWIKLGRQPKSVEMQKPISQYNAGAYEYRFGTWRKALEKFIEYINKDEIPQVKKYPIIENEDIATKKESIITHKTKRDVSERLKVQVLMRDGNKCRLCGITVTGENIHFDHIKAWSKGGETVLENLQVLCAKHNLAKGNL